MNRTPQIGLGSTLLVAALVLLTATGARATFEGTNGKIAFRKYLDPSKTTGALFTVNPDGTVLRQITRPLRGVVDQYADWSPNGRKIAFERNVPCPPGGPKNGLDKTCDLVYTVARDGKRLSRLLPCDFKEVSHGVHTPAWSPDASRIAFRYSLSDDRYVDSLDLNTGIWIVNADGTRRHQVTQRTPSSSWDFEPQWSPDGSRLVFAREDLKRQRAAVFTVSPDGSGLFRVTPWALSGGNRPDWSPDGKWILFTAHPRDGSENVYKVHPDGADLTNLTKQRAQGYHYLSSTFSPDGSMIVSARTAGGGPEGAADVVVMNADGSGIRPLMTTRLWESGVDWGPR